VRSVLSAGFAALIVMCAAACGHGSRASAPASATVHETFGNRSRGADIFRANCAVCHTTSGAAAGIGPSLENEKKRQNYDQTVAWIENPDPPMPKLYPAPLSAKDVDDVATYVQSL
jgi:mono/diheme cytochrome c family protein